MMEYPGNGRSRAFLLIIAEGIAIYLAGCAARPALPDISLPEIIEEPCSPIEKWRKAFDVLGQLLEEGRALVDRATGEMYSLVGVSMLVPTIEDPCLQRAILLCAQENGVFANRELTEHEARKIGTCWEYLAKADRCFLHAQLIVAELRQKWPDWVFFPYLPNPVQFPEPARRLQNAPTVAWCESWRREIEDLLQVCRQLLARNPSIYPPSDR